MQNNFFGIVVFGKRRDAIYNERRRVFDYRIVAFIFYFNVHFGGFISFFLRHGVFYVQTVVRFEICFYTPFIVAFAELTIVKFKRVSRCSVKHSRAHGEVPLGFVVNSRDLNHRLEIMFIVGF